NQVHMRRSASAQSSVMRSAAVTAKGARVAVNTHSDPKKYRAPAGLVPEIARSVAPAPKIKSGVENADGGMASAVATTGEISTSAAPESSQCATVFAITITVKLWPDR